MAIVLVNVVYFILIVLCHSAVCRQIDRSLCLETVVEFINDHENCNFNKSYAQTSLKDENFACQMKCHVEIKNVADEKNLLWEVDLSFGNAIFTYESICSTGKKYNQVTMSLDCSEWNAGKVPVGGYCKHDAQCRRSDYSVKCAQERCVCRAGYVLIDFYCHEGNLALNQSCASIEQCAGSPYASCLGGRCSCLEGYTPENSTDCKQIQKISLPNSLHPQANTGSIVGALFGGLLIGVIFTTAAGAVIYRRSHTHLKKREELNDFDNDSYAKVDHQNDLQIAKTKDKTRELSPNSCLGETSVYSLSSGKPSDRQTHDTVYNHLHEQVKRDDADYYDHACAVPAYNGDMGDYSHLHQVMT